MQLDIRVPVGLLFVLIGAVLVVYGVISDPAIYAAHSLGLNINLIWGAAMAAFGVALLALTIARRRS